MTREEFITKIVDAYCRAHIPLYPHPKLTRGEARSISAETEDLMAFYLAERFPQIDHIYINQPLIRQGHPRIKPDLVICRDAQMRVFLDAKMDLGWKRSTFDQMLRDTDTDMAQMRGEVFTLRIMEASEKTPRRMALSKNAKYLFPAISDLNISPQVASKFRECAAPLANVRLYFLTGVCHPNSGHLFSCGEVMERIKIDTRVFEDMEHEIQELLG